MTEYLTNVRLKNRKTIEERADYMAFEIGMTTACTGWLRTARYGPR